MTPLNWEELGRLPLGIKQEGKSKEAGKKIQIYDKTKIFDCEQDHTQLIDIRQINQHWCRDN